MKHTCTHAGQTPVSALHAGRGTGTYTFTDPPRVRAELMSIARTCGEAARVQVSGHWVQWVVRV